MLGTDFASCSHVVSCVIGFAHAVKRICNRPNLLPTFLLFFCLLDVVEDGEEIVDSVALEHIVVELNFIQNLRLPLLLTFLIVCLDLLHQSSNEASFSHTHENGHISQSDTFSHVLSHFFNGPPHLHFLFFEDSDLQWLVVLSPGVKLIVSVEPSPEELIGRKGNDQLLG